MVLESDFPFLFLLVLLLLFQRMSNSDYKQQDDIKLVYHSNNDISYRHHNHGHDNIDPHDYDTKIPGNKKTIFHSTVPSQSTSTVSYQDPAQHIQHLESQVMKLKIANEDLLEKLEQSDRHNLEMKALLNSHTQRIAELEAANARLMMEYQDLSSNKS